ncbi:Stf0 family sulfotransferase [Tateyamaria pelophila]|uniref:Stf0 family sulfotransferase n=1 Tax=Tateyamaria pelophila TaxID=328415 RepID=UPI001CBF7E3F|nr:Stf0 family sulfotransferase [Tateyamaria pelophila]
MSLFDSYFLCTSPRSGSTFLCTLLEDCGAGHPASYFHRPSLTGWRSELGLCEETPREDIFATARKRGMGRHPISGVRLQRPSLGFFRHQLAQVHPEHPNDLSRITYIFGRTAFIHLTRTDKLDQAVSLIRAQQSGLWHRNADGSELERTGPAKAAEYDAEAIQAQQTVLRRMDQDWEDWFARQGISPLRVTYAALSTDPQAVLQRLLSELGLPTEPANSISARTAKLADHVNADWVARFRAKSP